MSDPSGTPKRQSSLAAFWSSSPGSAEGPSSSASRPASSPAPSAPRYVQASMHPHLPQTVDDSHPYAMRSKRATTDSLMKVIAMQSQQIETQSGQIKALLTLHGAQTAGAQTSGAQTAEATEEQVDSKTTVVFNPPNDEEAVSDEGVSREVAFDPHQCDGPPHDEVDYRTMPRKSYTFHKKVRVIERTKVVGIPYSSVEHGISEITLRGFMKDEWHIREQVFYGRGSQRKYRKLTKYKTLFEDLYTEYVRQRDFLHGMCIESARLFCALRNDEFAGLSFARQYENLRTFKRHFGLCIRRTTSTAQFLPIDADIEVREFIRLLRRAFDWKRPQRIVVLDETSIQWYAPLRTTLAEIGSQSVKAISPNDRLASTGLLVGECHLTWTNGVLEPTLSNVKHHSPWIIFKNGWKATTWQQMRRAKQSGVCTDSGWMTSFAMVDWINMRLDNWCGEETWLIMDLYAAHKDEKVLEKLKSRNITPFFIPPGLTSLLQVHDTHINKSFKNEMRTLRASWRAHNEGDRIGRDHILAWSQAAIDRVPTDLLQRGIMKNIIRPILATPHSDVQFSAPPVHVPEKKQRGAKVTPPVSHFGFKPATKLPNEQFTRSHKKKYVVDPAAEEKKLSLLEEKNNYPDMDDFFAIQHTIDHHVYTDAEKQQTEAALKKQVAEDVIRSERVVIDVDADDSDWEPEETTDSLVPGAYISGHILGRALAFNNVAWVDTQMILHPEYKLIPSSVQIGVVNVVGVLVWHASHFLAGVAEKSTSIIYVYDSLPTYSHETRDIILRVVARFFGTLWKTTMSPLHVRCERQLPRSNDCGVHAVNNILKHMKRGVAYTREGLRPFSDFREEGVRSRRTVLQLPELPADGSKETIAKDKALEEKKAKSRQSKMVTANTRKAPVKQSVSAATKNVSAATKNVSAATTKQSVAVSVSATTKQKNKIGAAVSMRIAKRQSAVNAGNVARKESIVDVVVRTNAKGFKKK